MTKLSHEPHNSDSKFTIKVITFTLDSNAIKNGPNLQSYFPVHCKILVSFIIPHHRQPPRKQQAHLLEQFDNEAPCNDAHKQQGRNYLQLTRSLTQS